MLQLHGYAYDFCGQVTDGEGNACRLNASVPRNALWIVLAKRVCLPQCQTLSSPFMIYCKN